MSFVASRIRSAAAGVALALSLAACGSTPSSSQEAVTGAAVMPTGCGDGGPTVLAVAGHANSPAPTMTTTMGQAVANAATAGTPVGVVSIEGVPRLVAAGAFGSEAGNSAAREADRAAFTAGVAGAVSGLRAGTPHAGYVQGVQTAADAVRAACATGGSIYLAGSGLQDTGALDFSRSGLLGADPREVVDFLRANDQLPDLTGISVTLVGIGATAPPQTPLDQASRNDLIAIWTAILEAAGASGVQVDPSPRSGPAPAGVPEVATVPVPEPPVFPTTCSVTNFMLPDTGPVGFLPDVATFRDRATARADLALIADALGECSAAKITLIGTTSSAGEQTPAGEAGRRELSQQRAEAVKAVLVDLGIEVGRITTVGDGQHFVGYENDRDPQGVLLPGPAARNRSVLLTVE